MYQPHEVGARLRNLRKRSGYSREKIAESIGRSPKYYADIERGTCGMSLETLISLADFYQVSLDYLVEGKGGSVADEQTEWMLHKVSGLKDSQRGFLINVLTMLEEYPQ